MSRKSYLSALIDFVDYTSIHFEWGIVKIPTSDYVIARLSYLFFIWQI